MKLTLIALGLTAIYSLTACGGKDGDDDHDEHDHKEKAHNEKDHDEKDHDEKDHDEKDHDEKDHDEKDHEDHADHDHDKIIAGPNGGRVLTIVEPHAEFFVTEDRKIQISFVDDDIKPVPAAAQVVNVVAGERSNPTNLSFERSGDVLISDKALPAGNDFPIVVQIKSAAGEKSVRDKFNLNLEQCPTCKYKEYACTCDHDEE